MQLVNGFGFSLDISRELLAIRRTHKTATIEERPRSEKRYGRRATSYTAVMLLVTYLPVTCYVLCGSFFAQKTTVRTGTRHNILRVYTSRYYNSRCVAMFSFVNEKKNTTQQINK